MDRANSSALGNTDIFDRLQAGIAIPLEDPDYHRVMDAVDDTFTLSIKLNNASNIQQIRSFLGEIIGQPVDESTTLFTPFHTNFGRHIRLGKNVIINHACSFLDLGGLTIEDDVMIGPGVRITSENHPVNIGQRKTMLPVAVVIRRNTWIGAGAVILPGVTIGENSVVAAGAVVSRDVPPNAVVGGVPARILKNIEQ